MTEPRFDRWTRRRFGHLAGSALAALAGWPAVDASEQRRRGKRCKKLGASCTPGKRTCCGSLRCDKTLAGNPKVLCCKGDGKPCRDPIDCCDELGCPDKTCVSTPSDRALKTNFGSVDPTDMLRRLRDVPITTWNYTSDNPAVRHIGPMAQNFATAFGVGADDRDIHPIDGQGVALAAIQGLVFDVERLREEHGVLTARLAALEIGRSDERL